MLTADLTEFAGVVMIALLLVCGSFALIVAGVATSTDPEDGRIRSAQWLLAIALGASVIWITVYAAGEDTHYGSGVSRWEHADRFVGSGRVLAAIGFVALTSLLLVASALAANRQFLRPLVSLAAAISCAFLLLAWFWMTAGH